MMERTDKGDKTTEAAPAPNPPHPDAVHEAQPTKRPERRPRQQAALQTTHEHIGTRWCHPGAHSSATDPKATLPIEHKIIEF